MPMYSSKNQVFRYTILTKLMGSGLSGEIGGLLLQHQVQINVFVFNWANLHSHSTKSVGKSSQKCEGYFNQKGKIKFGMGCLANTYGSDCPVCKFFLPYVSLVVTAYLINFPHFLVHHVSK